MQGKARQCNAMQCKRCFSAYLRNQASILEKKNMKRPFVFWPTNQCFRDEKIAKIPCNSLKRPLSLVFRNDLRPQSAMQLPHRNIASTIERLYENQVNRVGGIHGILTVGCGRTW